MVGTNTLFSTLKRRYHLYQLYTECMGMESFGKAKEILRAAVLGGSVVVGAVASEGAMGINRAEAQTVHQESSGNNSPNIIGRGNVIIHGTGETGKPNISTRTEGPIHQRSEHDSSPNIITGGDVVVIDGKVYPKKK